MAQSKQVKEAGNLEPTVVIDAQPRQIRITLRELVEATRGTDRATQLEVAAGLRAHARRPENARFRTDLYAASRVIKTSGAIKAGR